jgi:hypothetical protein
MMTTKEFLSRVACSDAEIGDRVNAGWQIHFMQFMSDNKLNVVFVREVTAPQPAPAQPVVTVEPVAATTHVTSKPLPAGITIMGLDEQPRSVPLSHNKFKTGDTRKVHVPEGVTSEAMLRGRDVYNRVMSEGEAAMKRASESFRPNFRAGATT